jgi:hypothetical protein
MAAVRFCVSQVLISQVLLGRISWHGLGITRYSSAFAESNKVFVDFKIRLPNRLHVNQGIDLTRFLAKNSCRQFDSLRLLFR